MSTKQEVSARRRIALLREAVGELLPIVEQEFADDPEPEDLPSWKAAIDKANEALKATEGLL